VSVAERFTARHRSRIEVVARRIAVQRDELVLVQREIEEMAAELRKAGSVEAGGSIEAAWRDLEAAGGVRLDADDPTRTADDQRRRDEAVEAQLAYLKRKMGRQK
jgi:hypothetical protein